jgi:hypothetical protein
MDERDNASCGCTLLPGKVYAYVMAYLISFKIEKLGLGLLEELSFRIEKLGLGLLEKLSFKIEKLGLGLQEERVMKTIIKDPIEATCDHSLHSVLPLFP